MQYIIIIHVTETLFGEKTMAAKTEAGSSKLVANITKDPKKQKALACYHGRSEKRCWSE